MPKTVRVHARADWIPVRHSCDYRTAFAREMTHTITLIPGDGIGPEVAMRRSACSKPRA